MQLKNTVYHLVFKCCTETFLFVEKFVCWMQEAATIPSKHLQNSQQ